MNYFKEIILLQKNSITHFLCFGLYDFRPLTL